MQRTSKVEIFKEMRHNSNMDECLYIFLYLTCIVSNTNEISVSTSIQKLDILPVVGENITLACIVTTPSTYRQLSWIDWNNNILANCHGMGCRNERNVTDMFKYSVRADSTSGNLTVSNLTVDDSGRYRCLIFTSSDSFASGIVLTVLSSSNVF